MNAEMKSMLTSLRAGLKEMESNKKIIKKISNDQIEKLPESIRSQAVELISKAEKGKLDMSELMIFSSSVGKKEQDEMKKNAEEAMNRVNRLKDEVEKDKEDLSAAEEKGKVTEDPKNK